MDLTDEKSHIWASPLLPFWLDAVLDGIIAIENPSEDEVIPRNMWVQDRLGNTYDGVADEFYPEHQIAKHGHFRPRRVRVGDIIGNVGVDGAGNYGPEVIHLMRKLSIKEHVDAAVDQLREAVDERAEALVPGLGRAPEAD